MRDLSEGELQALRNLAEKRGGGDTAFLNIADARQLTELGLAIRSRQGWEITEAGVGYLNRIDAAAKDGHWSP
jgi:hypothetical protein